MGGPGAWGNSDSRMTYIHEVYFTANFKTIVPNPITIAFYSLGGGVYISLYILMTLIDASN